MNKQLFTVSALHAKLCLFAEKGLNVYYLKWIKKQLKQHYKNSIFFKQAVRGTRPFKGSLFYRYGNYHIIRAMVQRF